MKLFSKLFFLFANFLISLISLSDSVLNEMNTTTCKAKPNVLAGHCAYFKQERGRFLKDDGENHFKEMISILMDHFFSGLIGPRQEPVIQFLAIQAPPHLFTARDEEGFKVMGPHYSVLAEMGKLLNYRLDF